MMAKLHVTCETFEDSLYLCLNYLALAMDAVNTNGKEAVRLCEHVVRQAFGDVVGRVASTLLNRGRCSALTVSRLAALPLSTTQASLIILLQHHLVGSTGGSRRNPPEEEMYEFDIIECLMRLRWGRMLALTEKEFGEEALAVVRQIFLYGKLTMEEIQDILAEYDMPASSLRRVVTLMLRRGFLEPTCAELTMLRSDQIDRRYRTKWVEKSASAGTKLHTPAVLQELKKAAIDEITDERMDFRNPSRALKELKVPKKSSSSALKGKSKGDNWDVIDGVPLRANYDKYNVLIRNEMIIQAATDRWNAAAGEVMRAVLTASIDSQSDPRELRTTVAVNVTQIVDRIPQHAYKLLMAGMVGTGSKNIPEITRQYLAVMSGDDLASGGGGGRFLTHSDGTSPTFLVELEAICTALKHSLLTELVRERIDEKAARVLAVIAEAKFASETMVRDCAMIPLREARHILSELQKLSLIDIQEVPKTAAKGRNMFPGNDFHLWSIDLRKAYGFLLSGVYKTAANVMQRRQHELEKRSFLLEKLERDDYTPEQVVEYLSAKDRQDYDDLNNALQMLSLAETRTDLIVMMLRDLPGGAPSS